LDEDEDYVYFISVTSSVLEQLFFQGKIDGAAGNGLHEGTRIMLSLWER
jgi:hypothetical protein